MVRPRRERVKLLEQHRIGIGEAMADRNLLAASLGDLTTWRNWRTILKAAFAERLTQSELATFKQLAGDREPPPHRVKELWIIAGRRSGKSRMGALISAYIASCLNHRDKLASGETGFVLTLAPSRRQADLVRQYCLAMLTESPVLSNSVVDSTSEEIRLQNDIVIGIHSASFRTVRGRTLLAAVFDESGYWRDESSTLPDIEAYRACVPALATANGILVGIGSPYRRVGLLHQKFAGCFGKDDPNVLVVKAPTEVLNPTIDSSVIERARNDDPLAALSEWDAEFRNDLSQFLDDGLIDAAIDYGRPLELPPRRSTKNRLSYFAFCDVSGGRHDAFTLAIGHKDESGRTVCDVVRGRAPPFEPSSVVAEYSSLLKDYGLKRVTADNYSGEWAVSAFDEYGIEYERAEKPKSQLYIEALPLFARGAVSIPDHPRLLRELRLLERRTHRSGKDSVDHGPNGSDDFANAVAGMLYLANGGDKNAFDESYQWVGAPTTLPSELAAWRQRTYWSRFPV